VYLTQEKSEKPAWSDTNERKATTTPATSDRLATVAPPSASAKRLDQSYLGLRDRVLAMGIESWPSSRNSGGSEGGAPASYRDLLDSLLHDG
ncbi:MAG TPA: hypothetical protein PK867_30010, partial [Pirellulales bacterium]|nr:hypothetical protein [Pirellulales bacterium]